MVTRRTDDKPVRCGFCMTNHHHNCVKDRLKYWVCPCTCWRKGRRTLDIPERGNA